MGDQASHPMHKNENEKRGTVQSFNISPKGSYEGLLVESKGEVIQVNFPLEWSASIAGIAAPGQQVHLEVEPHEQHDHGLHPVYRLRSVSNEKKEKFPSSESNHKDGHFTGTVTRLNYALHGEVNGAILDTGDFLHVKPHGANALGLEVGMKVKGTGARKPMVGEHHVIEADEVNGVRLEKKEKPKKHAHD